MGWYYVITQEIREAFDGKEADVFAVINGYSQEGQGCFYGSLSMLSQFCGIKSKTTTSKILKNLVSMGAIIKEEEMRNGVKFCSYKVNGNWNGMPKIDMGGISKIGTNNKEYINNERDNNKRSHFVKPSISEVADYCRMRNNGIDPEEFVAFYESKGWMVGRNPMKDWKSAVITWEKSKKREKVVPQRKREATRKESVFEHNLKVMDQMFGTNTHDQIYNRKEACDEQ